MIRNLSLTAGLLALSALAFAPNVVAQAVPVPFSGNITNVCTFFGTSSGILAQPGVLRAVEGSGGIPGGFGTGTAGATTVACNAGGTLTTAVPVLVAVPAGFAPAVLQSVVYDGVNYTQANIGGTFDTGTWVRPATALIIPIGLNTSLRVGMIAGTNTTTGFVPSGDYSYNVTLTATPN